MKNNTPAILVENISKQYRLGEVGTGTLSHDLSRWWRSIRGKDDPFLKVGETNDRSTKSDNPYVWALQDINFEVEKGEVLGIIGKNGAGKSTLLKILSRVTSPTTGSIKARGRIASLLEVGTGFHPEMTGRENIYMNGTIMGMSRHEIKAKLDEIASFAGVDRYLDTPVKRYSSGMTVRLGFSIAAHLDPEILIVDEVLAVGDAEFQKKAIGKMKDVSMGEGRTVLFVSHNMASVKTLCTRGMILEKGQVSFMGEVETAMSHYLGDHLNHKSLILRDSKYETSDFRFIELTILTTQNKTVLDEFDQLVLSCKLEVKHPQNLHITYVLYGSMGEELFTFTHAHDGTKLNLGINEVKCFLPKGFLNIGDYSLSLYLIKDSKETIFVEHNILHFQIQAGDRPHGSWMGKEPGFIKPTFDWEIS